MPSDPVHDARQRMPAFAREEQRVAVGARLRVELGTQRGQLPPLALELPDDPRVRDLVVIPHALQSYDPTPAKESKDV